MKPLRRSPLLTLLSALLLAPAPAARAASWRPIGPEGGYLLAVAEAPNGRTLYTSSGTAGLFKSADGGRTWRRLAGSLPYPGPLAVDAVSSARLYVGTAAGLYRTEDGGTTWERIEGVPPAFPAAAVSALLADPQRPGVAWAAYAAEKRLLQTSDGGATWRPRDRGLAGRRVVALTAHPRLTGRLYAATDDGVYASRDGGGSWFRLGLHRKGIADVAVDAGNEEMVHAVAVELVNHYGITTDRLYRLSRSTHGTFVSENGGNGLGSNSYTRIAADPRAPGRTYAVTGFGIFVQSAPGGAWERFAEQGAGDLLPSRVRPGTLYALEYPFGETSLLISRDGGASWSPTEDGLNAAAVRQIAVDPADGDRLYARVGCCQLWRSQDGGAHWGRVAQEIPLMGFAQVLADPGHPGTAYLATNLSLWKSEDGGDVWRNLGIAPYVLALDPGGAGLPPTLYGDDPIFPRLQLSHDGGVTWDEVGDGLYTGVLAVAQGGPPRALYANGYLVAPDNGHLYRDRLRRTTDGGTVWATLLVPERGDTLFTAIADVDAAGHRIYASFFEADHNFQEAAGGIFRSTDGGRAWTALDVAPGRPPVDTIAVDPRDSAHLYAGTPGGGIYESRDAGTTWASIAGDLPRADVKNLTLDPHDPDRLFVSLYGGGAYVREGSPR